MVTIRAPIELVGGTNISFLREPVLNVVYIDLSVLQRNG